MSDIRANARAHAREAERIMHGVASVMETRRSALGLTIAEMGKRAGVSERNIKWIKSGDNNSRLSTLVGLARALEMPLVELLSATGGEP